MISIYPCLWFDGQGHRAAERYCDLFSDTEWLQTDPPVTTFVLNGTKMMALDGGPHFAPNPAVSFFVYCGGSEAEIDRLYAELARGGRVLMPLDRYDWSPRYAWVADSFGVNWQLDVEPIRSPQKIVPSLLFGNEKRGQVKAALDQYVRIFPDSRSLLEAPYPESAGQPAGALLFAQFKLGNFILNAMSSPRDEDFDFTPATSLVVQCDTQEEIDYYWAELSAGGKPGRCGWLTDRFGVSWQVVPAVLPELLADPERGARVREAFLKMGKFELDVLLRSASKS